jgi:hypothetical protein
VPSMRRNGRPICAGEKERGERCLRRSRRPARAKGRSCGSHRGVPRLRRLLDEVVDRVAKGPADARRGPSATFDDARVFALARWAAGARVLAGESVREVVRRGHVLIVVLELLGRNWPVRIDIGGRESHDKH